MPAGRTTTVGKARRSCARRQHRDWLNPAWTAAVWATPAALALAALLDVGFDVTTRLAFWLPATLAVATAPAVREPG
jgi:hypothetical protein